MVYSFNKWSRGKILITESRCPGFWVFIAPLFQLSCVFENVHNKMMGERIHAYLTITARKSRGSGHLIILEKNCRKRTCQSWQGYSFSSKIVLLHLINLITWKKSYLVVTEQFKILNIGQSWKRFQNH